jgi:hypothetical protein
MTYNRYRQGKLCLPTLDAACQAVGSSTAKAIAKNDASVMSAAAHERLHKYVLVTPECWLWTGSFNTHRGRPTYGQFYLEGRRVGAHRASYILHVGPVPDGLDILHSCDIKACVNPAHLRPGTHTENIREAFAKLPADYFAGENAGHVTLSWAKVHAIREAHATGTRQSSLARAYGVSPVCISGIVRGKRWDERHCPVHNAELVA